MRLERIPTKQAVSTLFAAALLGSNASAAISVAGTFAFSVDAAQAGSGYSSTLAGNDTGGGNLYSADSPISISTGTFNAIGTKLVAVLSLHNSAVYTSVPTAVTFGGAALNQVSGVETPTTSTRQYIYYLDNVASNGSFSFAFDVVTGGGTFQSSFRGVDEVGLQLFALNGAATGTAYASESSSFGGTGSPFSSPADALAGDFIVGVAQRNNGGTSISVGSPYTSTSLTAGNNGVTTGYLIADSSGFTAPVFSKASGGSTVYQSFAAFAAVPEPGSMGLIALGGMLLFRRRR